MASDTVKSRPPSIRDVARLANVSHQTVSRVLNRHPSVRPETKLSVLNAMETLQYRPNRAARTLVTSRSRTIGVLSASSSWYGPAASIQAIEEAAREVGYLVNTTNCDGGNFESILDALRHLNNQAIEGLVVIAPQVRVFDAIEQMSLGIPFVSLQNDERLPGKVLSVDQMAGARFATRHLLDLGHRRVYHFAGPQDWIEAKARMRGFLSEMAAVNASMTAPILGDWSAEFGYHAGRELLRKRDFTAVFSANDQMALGLMHAVRDASLDVPRDVSIVGFDDVPGAAHFWPPLTTVRQDFGELGRRAVALLLDDITGDGEGYGGMIIPSLIVRASTALPSF